MDQVRTASKAKCEEFPALPNRIRERRVLKGCLALAGVLLACAAVFAIFYAEDIVRQYDMLMVRRAYDPQTRRLPVKLMAKLVRRTEGWKRLAVEHPGIEIVGNTAFAEVNYVVDGPPYYVFRFNVVYKEKGDERQRRCVGILDGQARSQVMEFVYAWTPPGSTDMDRNGIAEYMCAVRQPSEKGFCLSIRFLEVTSTGVQPKGSFSFRYTGSGEEDIDFSAKFEGADLQKQSVVAERLTASLSRVPIGCFRWDARRRKIVWEVAPGVKGCSVTDQDHSGR